MIRNMLIYTATGILVALVTLCCWSPVQAEVLYSTFGPGDSYDPTTGWVVGDDTGQGTRYQVAAPILNLSSELSYLDSIEFAALLFRGDNASPLTISIALDAGTFLPGAILESVTITNIQSASAVYTASFSSTTLLDNNLTYWVILSPDLATDDAFFWMWNDLNRPNAAFWSTDTNQWTYDNFAMAPAFAVNGTPVTVIHEPSSVLLMGAGLIAAGLLRKRLAK
jgi:hypothetical protein